MAFRTPSASTLLYHLMLDQLLLGLAACWLASSTTVGHSLQITVSSCIFPIGSTVQLLHGAHRDQTASSGQRAHTNTPHGRWKVAVHSGACMRLCTYFVIQVIIALIHLVLPKIPLVLYMDMRVELPRLSLGKLEEQPGHSITGNAQMLYHCSTAQSKTSPLVPK